MVSETLQLQMLSTAKETIDSWHDTLVDYLRENGFTVSDNALFGKKEDDAIIGLPVTSTNGIYLRFTLYGYQIEKHTGVYSLGESLSFLTDNVHIIIGNVPSTTTPLIINKHIDDNNKYLDFQYAGYLSPYHAFLITKNNALDVRAENNIEALVFEDPYIRTCINANTRDDMSDVKSMLDLKPLNSKYTCCISPVVTHYKNNSMAILPSLVGIIGNFNYAFGSVIGVDDKEYYCLGNNIYMPLN